MFGLVTVNISYLFKYPCFYDLALTQGTDGQKKGVYLQYVIQARNKALPEYISLYKCPRVRPELHSDSPPPLPHPGPVKMLTIYAQSTAAVQVTG